MHRGQVNFSWAKEIEFSSVAEKTWPLILKKMLMQHVTYHNTLKHEVQNSLPTWRVFVSFMFDTDMPLENLIPSYSDGWLKAGNNNSLFLNSQTVKNHSVRPRYNEPLYDEDPGITNHILQPSNNKMYGKEPR